MLDLVARVDVYTTSTEPKYRTTMLKQMLRLRVLFPLLGPSIEGAGGALPITQLSNEARPL
jgi:hypothetical protein